MGLPTIFLIIFFQKQDGKEFKWDKIVLFAYFILAFAVLVMEHTPKDWNGVLTLFIAYLIGVATSVIAGIFYVVLYEVDKPTNFKLRMLFAFSISAIVMIFVFLMLDQFKLLAFLGA
jgi:heme O synthase-like polyprenyltransferase